MIETPDGRRRSIRRTALVLLGIVLFFYFGFILLGVLRAHG